MIYINKKDEVVIMGHSIAGPDLLYYSEVLVPYLKNSKWTVMRYIDENGKATGFEDKIAPLENLLGKKASIADW